MRRLSDLLSQPVNFRSARARVLAAAVVVAAGVLAAVLTQSGHHHHHQRVAQTTRTQLPQPIASTTQSGTTPWTAPAIAKPSAGPAAVTPAAQQFALSYVAFLRGQQPASSIAHASASLRAQLAQGKSAPIPVHGAASITGVHTDAPQGDGTVPAIVQVQVGQQAFGLEVVFSQQSGQWIATSVPTTHGTF